MSVHATISSLAGSRRVRATFHANDDAYVVVGHIDADGVLRIVFPTDPADDGFVKGSKTYQTTEFFAGFNDQYNFRYRTASMYRTNRAESDSYDRGMGYVFIIATWRPMRFDRFATNGEWDSFELADADYMKDPRPAVYELASLLSGENREAVTVKFATYFNTQTLYSGYDGYSADGFNYCAGYEPLGFMPNPLGAWYGSPMGYMNRWNILNGYGFSYRGTNYYYDSANGCYRQSFPVFGNGFGGYIAQSPLAPPPSRPRAFNIDAHRPPMVPRELPDHRMPLVTPANGADEHREARFSPEYRQRGLITEEGGAALPAARRPRVEAAAGSGQERTRPGLEEMLNRRVQTEQNEGWSGTTRNRARVDDGSTGGTSSGYTPPARVRTEPVNNGAEQARPRFTPSDSPRSAPSEPVTREPAPRMEAPPRMSPPPSSPPPSAPPPRVSPPAESRPPASPPPPSSSPKVSNPGK